MTRETAFEKLRSVMAEILERDMPELTEKLLIQEIEGMDSLQYITLLATLEGEFHMRFNMDRMLEMKTVKDLLDALMEAE